MNSLNGTGVNVSIWCITSWAQLFKTSLAFLLVKGHFVNCFSGSIHNILIFFAEKMWAAFALHCKSYSHFFSEKFQNICVSLDVNFNESLTNNIVSFEQLGPEFQRVSRLYLCAHSNCLPLFPQCHIYVNYLESSVSSLCFICSYRLWDVSKLILTDIPAGTCRLYNVALTSSWRCIDVNATLYKGQDVTLTLIRRV